MHCFKYHDGQLWCERISLDELAERTGTPAYVYSRRTFEDQYKAIAQAFSALDPLICYSIKSCGNVNICKLLGDLGAGMDVVSGGELARAKQAGVPMNKVVYAGVGKTAPEIRSAIEAKIGWFNIESEAEFEAIAKIAKEMGGTMQAALRVNPDVDPQTHAKTSTGKKESKFGVDLERAYRFFETYGQDEHLRLNAIHLHIGSPVYSTRPYVEAITRALTLIEKLQASGHQVNALDIGGGFGADYESDQSPSFAQYAADIVPVLEPFHRQGGRVILEPGRSIAANAGVLLTRVQYIKVGGRKKFVIVDSGMHHLIRPTLYDSFHFIWPTQVSPTHEPEHGVRKQQMSMSGLETCDVVGPICESGDYLALDRSIPPTAAGQLLCVFSAGAYGMAMASNYNAMPKPPEVLVDGEKAMIIRRRETYQDLMAPELDAHEI